MEQKMQVLVLGANRYSFEDQQTKREIEGTKVHYVSLEPISEDNSKGLLPKAETMEYGYFKELGTVPGIYEATVQFVMHNRGLRAKIVNFKFLEPVTFELPVKA
ncbi:hypothetical protein [Brevibacillus reuszeri]|uniref:hypothetical protein n=1 Tax=Brevibacillus reuszeri TaxID=54915 RepID=UPI000CCC757C|nr:hypothetical protein [Brevibacillus reuszeri]